VTLARGDGATFTRLPSVDWRYLAGGLLGAFYVWAVLWSVPTLGVVTAFAALILGQLGMAMLLDAIGAFGLAVHSITPLRIASVLLVGAGLVLSRY
jgi:transporter family-2 protein